MDKKWDKINDKIKGSNPEFAATVNNFIYIQAKMPHPAEVVERTDEKDVELRPESPKLEIPTVQEFQRSLGEGSFIKNSD